MTGQISTVGADGADGNATILVFGNVRCSSVQNDWARLILISGGLNASSFVFTGREDSAMFVGGDFKTPMFIGSDIWIEVGGKVEIELGIGYAINFRNGANIHPKIGQQNTIERLNLTDSDNEVSEIDRRVSQTGTVWPE